MSSPPFFLLFLFFLSAPLLLLAQSPPSPPSPSSSLACKTTLYPKLCRSILSAIRASPSDPYGYGKFSIKQSLKQARKLAKVFEDFLHRHQSSSSLKHAEVASLGDCKDLNQLNVDYLTSVSEELKSVSSSDTELVEKIESYLSAVATNHYTCYDGLVVTKSNIANALAVPLKDVTQFYSVSLGLVTEALDKNLRRNKTRKHGLPTKTFKVRQPLEKLIKVIIVSLHRWCFFLLGFDLLKWIYVTDYNVESESKSCKLKYINEVVCFCRIVSPTHHMFLSVLG